ncbi:unnamed protein product [Cuscuta campestris]|uniref:HAT C-terminal dimerisation domain-containing protein n=1 Tax=Cuscuta campestris TaxID=132261 RepID=A0A484LEG1_9ASTE|nr:unnamed protein product [Cuscuta campestris]
MLEANILLGWKELQLLMMITMEGVATPNLAYASWIMINTQIQACLLPIIIPTIHKHAPSFITLLDVLATRGDANLPTLDSLFKDVDEAGLDNLDGDEEPTPHNNDVDVEAGEPETSRGPEKEETAPPLAPKSKKGFKGIVGGLLAKKGKRAQPSGSSSGTTVSSHNELAMYQGLPCDYDEDDVEFDVLGWWKQNEHMFPSLAMLARQVLSVPVSTIAVEREFSAGGNILTDYQSCLNAESLETLVCNQDWLLARRRAQESSYQLDSEHYMNVTTDGSLSSEE